MKALNCLNKNRIWICLLVMLAVLLFTGTVFADDEIPSETAENPAAEESSDPAEESQEVIASISAESGNEEGIVVDEGTPSDEQDGEESAVSDDDINSGEAEIAETSDLDAAVEDGGAGTVDEGDPTSPEGSDGSIQLSGSGDPYWLVGTQYYSVVPTGTSCYGNSNEGADTCWVIDPATSTDLISFALSKIEEGLLPNDRKLYVGAGSYTGDLNISGTYLSQLNGLIGVDGSDATTIVGDITISNNLGGFTLSGFTIVGGVQIVDSSGSVLLQNLDISSSPSGDGISVDNHNGNITLKNVESNSNLDSGATLDNSVYGNVAVSDSIFNANGNYGLSIETFGTVSLTNVIASTNQIGGISVYGYKAVSLKNVIANDTVGNEGIWIYTYSGAITLENVTANGNGYDGVAIIADTTGTVTIKNLVVNDNNINGLYLTTKGAVVISNCQANGNINNNGLYIITGGKVTLNSIRSSNNGENGVWIEGIETKAEIWGPGNGWEVISVASPIVSIGSPANAAQANIFDGNGSCGIWVITDKTVAISNFSASGNTSNGVLVEGYWYYKQDPITGSYNYTEKFAGATTIKATIPNYTNQVNTNSGPVGLGIYSNGTVYLEKIVANNNSYHGIEINTYGSITLKDVKASGNISGCVLYNADAPSLMPITLTNVEFSSNNTADYGGAGLDIHSRGNVTITNLVASNNADMGAGVINTSGTGRITLTKITLNNNGANGLWADSNGIITLATVTASGNGDDGLKLSNNFTGYKSGINLTDVQANNNNGNGILVNTNGMLVAKNITANNNATFEGEIWEENTVQDFFNQSKGVDKWWFYASEGTTYTLLLQADTEDALNRLNFNPFMQLFDESDNPISGSTSSEFNNYYQIVFTPGSGESGWYYVNASSTTNDGYYRLSINNPAPTEETTIYYWASGLNYSAVGNITINGNNEFSENSVAGVKGWNCGNVTASNISASGNGSEGIYFDTLSGIGNVNLSGVNTTGGNGWDGLRVDTNGTVSITNLDSSGNGQDGIYIAANTTGKAVTMNHITALENSQFGLFVVSAGNITLNNIRANGNTATGIYLDNTAGTGNILIAGFNEAENNIIKGVDVSTNGLVTIGNLDASGNTQDGVYISASGVNKAVTLNNVTANENSRGLYVSARGIITLNNVRSWLNSGDGAFLDSHGYAIMMKYSSFMANDNNGLGYVDYQTSTYPLFKFTNIGSIFMGNGNKDLSLLH